MVMHMSITVERKRISILSKKQINEYHIKNNYKRFKSTNGYLFWAKDKQDAFDYCKQMNLVLGDLDETKKDIQ